VQQIMLVLALALAAAAAGGGGPLPTDTFGTQAGPLVITFVGHGSLILDCAGTVVHVDPWGKLADYTKLPKADLVLITHEHPDHLDPEALAAIRKAGTVVAASAAAAEKIEGAVVMGNGDVRTLKGLRVEAVPAYNLVHLRENGEPFHPKGRGNGYVLTCGGTRVYVAGDTENVPEMKALKDIDIAFLPMNLPYTMTPEMVADAARAFTPRVLYPYHYGDTDPQRLVDLLADAPGIDVRIRPMR
jgi:L-ascorbate metabolism protein UlaG (beta-lactamase superfamily)